MRRFGYSMFLLVGCLLVSVAAQAKFKYKRGDFDYEGMKYIVTSDSTATCAGTIDVKGAVAVPGYVRLNDRRLKVTAIGVDAFNGERELTEVTLPPFIREIGGDAFFGCTMLRAVHWGDSIRLIDESAFCECTQLVIDTWPRQLETIGQCAFSNCTALTADLVLPSQLRVVGWSGFSQCEGIRSVTFTGDVQRVASQAFGGCLQLEKIVFEGDVDSLTASFSELSALKEVEFKKGLHYVEDGVFRGCTSLKRVVLPYGMRLMGRGLFSGCTALEEAVIPSKTTVVDSETFQNCRNLKTVTLPATLETLSDAFRGCSALQQLSIPHAVNSIYCDLRDCEALQTIVCMAKIPPTIYGDFATEQMYRDVKVIVPAGCETTYRAFDGWKRFQHIEARSFDKYPCFAKVQIAVDRFSKWPVHGAVKVNGQVVRSHEDFVEYDEGTDVVVEVIPDVNYAVETFKVNGEERKADLVDGVYRVKAMGDLAIVAEFMDKPVVLTIRMSDLADVKVSAPCNHNYRYYLKPNPGWELHSVTFNGVDMTPFVHRDLSLKTPVITDDALILVAFEKPSGIDLPASRRLKVLAVDDGLLISGAECGDDIRIYDVAGRLLRRITADGAAKSVSLPKGQVYLVQTIGKTIKVRL